MLKRDLTIRLCLNSLKCRKHDRVVTTAVKLENCHFSKSSVKRAASYFTSGNFAGFQTPEVWERAMFSAACYQFVKTTGSNTLHPTPSLEEKDNVVPLQLVVKTKKRRFIFFEKAYFHPAEFQLSDVLTNVAPLDVPLKEEDLVQDYNRTTKLSLKGKFGADICNEIIDVDIEASDTISLSIKFGKVVKSEIDVDQLLGVLRSRNLNLDHAYIQQIRQDKRKSLCVVTGVASLASGGTISRVTDVETSASGKLSVLKNTSTGAEASYEKDRELGLAAKTAVAYKLHELNIGTRKGDIMLMLAKGQHGGWCDTIGYDETDATSIDTDAPGAGQENKEQLEIDLQHPKSIFHAFLSLPAGEREELRSLILGLLSVSRDVGILAAMIDKVEQKAQMTLPVSELQRKIFTPKEKWLRLLEIAGFVVNEHDELVPPRAVTGFISGLGELFDAVTSLDDEYLDLVRMCSPGQTSDLLVLLQDGLRGKAVPCSQVSSIVKDPGSVAQKLLLELRYQIGAEMITPPDELPFEIDEVYWILYALWGTP